MDSDDDGDLLEGGGWDIGISKPGPKGDANQANESGKKNEESEDDRKHDSEDEDAADGDDNQGQHQSIFSLEEKDFMFNNYTYKQVVAAAGCFFIVTTNNTIIYAEEERYMEYELDQSGELNIYKIFVDPTGTHVLITMRNGDNHYVNTNMNKNPKLQPKMKNVVIESVGWDKFNNRRESTGTILIGTQDSCIYEARFDTSKEACRHFKLLFDLKEKLDVLVQPGPITGLEIELFPKIKGSADMMNHFYVMVATPFRYFEFVGGPTFEELFYAYKNASGLVYKELPFTMETAPNSISTTLYLQKSHIRRPADSFAWLSQSGIYHGTVSFAKKGTGTSCLVSTQLITYDTFPLAFGITDYHLIIVYQDKVVVLMQPSGLIGGNAEDKEEDGILQVPISAITVVFEETIPKSRGTIIGYTYDIQGKEMYVYTEMAIFKLSADQEDRDVWRLYLERALNPKISKEAYFQKALKIVETDPKRKDIVLTAKGDYYFRQKKFDDAANILARTTKSFEEVAMGFLNKGQKDSLRKYLLNKLKLILHFKDNDSNSEGGQLATQQLTCLCTWIVELYLDKLNEMFDSIELAESIKTQKFPTTIHIPINIPTVQGQIAKMKTDLISFLEKQKDSLHKETTFKLLFAHGKMDLVLEYARITQDYEKILGHYLTERAYNKALEVLATYCVAKAFENYYYKFGPILIQHLAKPLVTLLISKRFLDPSKLIPSLMTYVHKLDHSKNQDAKDEKENQAIRYLEYCVFESTRPTEDPAVHNLLLFLYAKYRMSKELLKFLNPDGENNFYDMKFALRVCKEYRETESCIRLYAAMGLYEDAVKLALEDENLDLARICAEKPHLDYGNFEKSKSLWLHIIKHVIEKQKNVKLAIQYLKITDKIKLEDVLPCLPDSVTLAEFQEDISNSLSLYKTQIEELREDMRDATTSAQLIRDDIKDIKNRYGYVSTNGKCHAKGCVQNILAREFYYFPCSHCFHVDCLVNLVKSSASETQKALIDELVAKKQKAASQAQQPTSTITSLNSNTSGASNASVGNENSELQNVIANECPYCGTFVIRTIDESFITAADGKEAAEWKI